MKFPRRIVLRPRDLWWEKKGVFNPAVIELNNKIYLIYRAVGADNISRFGLAISDDGEYFQVFDDPILESRPDNPVERLGIEDPRAVSIDGTIYITYTSASVYPCDHKDLVIKNMNKEKVPWCIRVSAFKTKDLKNFTHCGVLLPNLDSKNGVLLPRKIAGQFVLFHRMSPNIYLTYSTDFKKWQGNLEIMRPQEPWEKQKIGVSTPPIETPYGWLMLYHGVDDDFTYRMGAALLDLGNPARILKRTKEPIFEPEAPWEKRGNVDNVVFPTGYINKEGMIWLYYGAADSVVGLTKISLDYLLSQLDD